MLNIKWIFQKHIEAVEAAQALIPQLETIAEKLTSYVLKGATIFWCGNGGSAADAQHLCAELVGRFYKERRSIASIALTTDTSVLTSISNDASFDTIFSRQLEGLCRPSDVLIAISTSGNSPNVLNAASTAKAKGAYVIGLTGHKGGKLVNLVDDCIVAPSDNTPRIQELHTLFGHTLCEWIEQTVAAHEKIQHKPMVEAI
jgi:D-sedoheptulose 7-phosphate isomerase